MNVFQTSGKKRRDQMARRSVSAHRAVCSELCPRCGGTPRAPWRPWSRRPARSWRPRVRLGQRRSPGSEAAGGEVVEGRYQEDHQHCLTIFHNFACRPSSSSRCSGVGGGVGEEDMLREGCGYRTQKKRERLHVFLPTCCNGQRQYFIPPLGAHLAFSHALFFPLSPLYI